MQVDSYDSLQELHGIHLAQYNPRNPAEPSLLVVVLLSTLFHHHTSCLLGTLLMFLRQWTSHLWIRIRFWFLSSSKLIMIHSSTFAFYLRRLYFGTRKKFTKIPRVAHNLAVISFQLARRLFLLALLDTNAHRIDTHWRLLNLPYQLASSSLRLRLSQLRSSPNIQCHNHGLVGFVQPSEKQHSQPLFVHLQADANQLMISSSSCTNYPRHIRFYRPTTAVQVGRNQLMEKFPFTREDAVLLSPAFPSFLDCRFVGGTASDLAQE